MSPHRTPRPHVHRPAAEPPFWKRLKVRIVALAGLALTSFLSLVLFPVVENVASDKAKEATAGPVLWASATSGEPAQGCAALREPLDARDRAAVQLDSGVPAIIQRHGGAWTNELSIDLSLRGGTGQATVTGIDVRPRGKIQPPLSTVWLCHPTAGSGPVAQLTSNLDVTPPVVKVKGRPYGERSAITVGAGEQIPANLTVSISRGYLEFDVIVTYAYKDRAAVSLPVYDGDPKLKRPFRITGVAPDYQAVYVERSGYQEATRRDGCALLPRKGC